MSTFQGRKNSAGTIAVAALAGLAAARPSPVPVQETPAAVKRCDYKLENDPWVITNLDAFHAKEGSGNTSYVTFHLADTNTGLKLNTVCTRELDNTDSPVDPNNYYTCENENVQFIYAGTSLSIQRTYTDDCVGEYPYNFVNVYGQNAVAPTNTTRPHGVLSTVKKVEVSVTQETS